MKKILKKGFTLIELLVVITIIGILATGGVTVYTGQMKKARDSVRIGDAKKLQTAIESFYQDINEYPRAGKFVSQNALDVQDYAPGLVQDSRHAVASCSGTAGAILCGYTYTVGTSIIARDSFELGVAFENPGSREQEALGDIGNDSNRLEILGGAATGSLDTSKNTGTFGTANLAASSTAASIAFTGTTTTGGITVGNVVTR